MNNHVHLVGAPKFTDLLAMEDWHTNMPGSVWRDGLQMYRDTPESYVVIQRHTSTGHPLGSERLMRDLEQIFGRRLHALPIGCSIGSRKRKEK